MAACITISHGGRTIVDAVIGDDGADARQPAQDRRQIEARPMRAIRGRILAERHEIGHLDDQPAVLEFVSAQGRAARAPMGTSRPDCFLRSKIRPPVIDLDPATPSLGAALADLPRAIAAYRADCAGRAGGIGAATAVRFLRRGPA